MYLFYAIRRFGFWDGVGRFFQYSVWPVVVGRPLRRWYRRWLRKDRRGRYYGSWTTKYAIDRDGDLGLVECPVCGDQYVHFDREKKLFLCGGGRADGHAFQVYLEDGVRQIRDHRHGNIKRFPVVLVTDHQARGNIKRFPVVLVTDHQARELPAVWARIYHLGITEDAPWWWERRDLYRDYNPKTGKDGHGHQLYKVVDHPHHDQAGKQHETGEARAAGSSDG